MKTKEELKLDFENGDKPTQEQFWEWQNSYWHKTDENDIIPANRVDLSKKADLIEGKIPLSQMPFADDVLDFPNFATFPDPGLVGKIYIDLEQDKNYIWDAEESIYKNAGMNDLTLMGKLDKPLSPNNVSTKIILGDGTTQNLSEIKTNIGFTEDESLTNGFEVPINDVKMLAFHTDDFERLIDEENGVVLVKSKGRETTETPTLEAVLTKGNSTTKPIIFNGVDGTLKYDGAKMLYIFGTPSPTFSGSDAIILGQENLKLATGSNNIISIGNYALGKSTLAQNTVAIGTYAFQELLGKSEKDVAIGDNVAWRLQASSGNVFLGAEAGSALVTGITVADLEAISPIVSTKAKTYYSYVSGYDATAQTYKSSMNVFIGAAVGGGSTAASRAIGSIVIGSSFLSNVKFRNFNNVIIGTAIDSSAAISLSNSVILGNNFDLRTNDGILAIDNRRGQNTIPSNALIYGTFEGRTLKINGQFSVLNTKLQPIDSTDAALYTKNLIAKTDGTFGWEDKISVPAPPPTGSYALKSVDGAMSWVNDTPL